VSRDSVEIAAMSPPESNIAHTVSLLVSSLTRSSGRCNSLFSCSTNSSIHPSKSKIKCYNLCMGEVRITPEAVIIDYEQTGRIEHVIYESEGDLYKYLAYLRSIGGSNIQPFPVSEGHSVVSSEWNNNLVKPASPFKPVNEGPVREPLGDFIPS
jgi:hypothetical protein